MRPIVVSLALLLALAPAAVAQHVVVRVAVFEPAGPGDATPPDHADDRKLPADLHELWNAIGTTGIRLTAINRLSMTAGDERDADRVHVKVLSADATGARVVVRVDGSKGEFSLPRLFNNTLLLTAAGAAKPESVAVSLFDERAGANVPDIFVVGGEVNAPVATSRVEPVYPEDQRAMRISGMVIVEALIDETGKVLDVHVLKNLPGTFGDAAVAAVKQWQFKPATRDGKAVAVLFNLAIQFKP